MIKKALALLLLPSLALAGQARFVVQNISKVEDADQIVFALNENFSDLAKLKQDNAATGRLSQPRFLLSDLDDPKNADQNTYAIMQNFQDLCDYKVGISTPSCLPRFLIENILDPKESETNTAKINLMFSDMWADLNDN